MDAVPFSRFISIYRGPSHTYKVQRLTEFTCYSFRIQAASEAGEGPFSETYTFSTTKSVPPAIKGLWTVCPSVCYSMRKCWGLAVGGSILTLNVLS